MLDAGVTSAKPDLDATAGVASRYFLDPHFAHTPASGRVQFRLVANGRTVLITPGTDPLFMKNTRVEQSKELGFRGACAKSEPMRLRMNDSRERKLDALQEASGENTKSGAIDTAADHYVRMAGGTSAVPTGAVEELMQLAVNEGSVTPAQIADVLDLDELPIRYEREWVVGHE